MKHKSYIIFFLISKNMLLKLKKYITVEFIIVYEVVIHDHIIHCTSYSYLFKSMLDNLLSLRISKFLLASFHYVTVAQSSTYVMA